MQDLGFRRAAYGFVVILAQTDMEPEIKPMSTGLQVILEDGILGLLGYPQTKDKGTLFLKIAN